MYLKSLLLKNFRRFSDKEIDFSPKINCILGNNGVGKTTLLEAIIFLSTGRSFRTNEYRDLIQEGKDYMYIEGHFDREGEELEIKVFFNGAQKKISRNGIHTNTFSSLLSSFPTVIFTPLDMQLIDNSPTYRRRFLNVQQAQIDEDYRYHLYRFSKVLQQRNRALRVGKASLVMPWEPSLSESGFYIAQKRKEMVDELNYFIEKNTSHLAVYSEEFMLSYAPSILKIESISQICSLYEETREKDIKNQITTLGIHRDDLLFVQKKSPKHMKKFSSEGQKRTALFAMKLAEWYRLQCKMEMDPIFCLDDLSLHLDSERLANFTQSLTELQQVIITSPVTLRSHIPSMHSITLDSASESGSSTVVPFLEK